MATFAVSDAEPTAFTHAAFTAGGVTDDELTELALAADPDAGVADDAIPLSELLSARAGDGGDELLPGWYMPAPMGSGRLLQGWRRRIVLLIVLSFVLINAYGLCSTYGHVGFD